LFRFALSLFRFALSLFRFKPTPEFPAQLGPAVLVRGFAHFLRHPVKRGADVFVNQTLTPFGLVLSFGIVSSQDIRLLL